MSGRREREEPFPKRLEPGEPGGPPLLSPGRAHTDVCCAGVLMITIFSMVGIVAYSFVEGDTRRLTHGFDFHGRLCGADPEVQDKPFLYFCGTQEHVGDYPRKLHFWSKTCVAKCPGDSQQLVPCLMRDFHNFTELPRATQNNITFLSTLNIEITQSVTLQRSYPTDHYKEHFCVPKQSSENSLRNDVIDGPLHHMSRLAGAATSFRRAWPVVLGAALLAGLLGISYLVVLNRFAGPLMFFSLCVGTAMMAALGLFFMVGVFMNPWDDKGGYQEYNPIFRTFYFYGHEAQAYSFLVGVIFCCAAVWLVFTTINSVERIDKVVGVIQAACDCIFPTGPGWLELLIQPVLQGLFVLVLVTVLFLGLLQVASVGRVELSGIEINGRPMQGLEKNFQYPWFWWTALTIYLFGSFWLIELAIAFGHFVVSYTVCKWFFVRVEKEEVDDSALGKAAKETFMGRGSHVPDVEVRGVDNYFGTRSGYVQQSRTGEKVLVVPLGIPGPEGKDYLPQLDDMPQERKPMPAGVCRKGLFDAIYYHLGSLAMGAIISPITRPLRWASMIVRAVVSKLDPRGRDPMDKRRGGTMIDNLVGGFSKTAYVDIVLGSSNYCDASVRALEYLLDARGAVALLHGSTTLYEVIAVSCITAICGGLSFVLMTKIEAFRDPNNDLYVSDPWTMTLLSSAICCIIAFSFMTLFNVIADTLLYVFVWSRRHHGSDLEKYVPTSLRGLVWQEMRVRPRSDRWLRRRGSSTMATGAGAKHINRLLRFSQQARRYAGTIMQSVRGGNSNNGEGSPLLSP